MPLGKSSASCSDDCPKNQAYFNQFPNWNWKKGGIQEKNSRLAPLIVTWLRDSVSLSTGISQYDGMSLEVAAQQTACTFHLVTDRIHIKSKIQAMFKC